MPEAVTVHVGQTWADNDPRSAGRTVRVDRIDGDKAVCTVLSNTESCVRDMRGKQTTISLARFKPTKTGYRLVSEAGQ
jgi:hypothetical protein